MAQIPNAHTLQLQSPYLYCAAAGSDQSDGSFGGVHLHWDLMKELGYSHIPKGKEATPGVGFNKSEDYVGLYRTAYSNAGSMQIDFKLFNSANITYLPGDEGIIYPISMGNFDNHIIVRFLDRAKFRYIVDSGLQGNAIQDFLDRYDGIIEIEVQGKLMMHYEVSFASGNGTGGANLETVSIQDRLDTDSARVVKREYKTFSQLMNGGLNTTAENIKCIRVQQNGMPAPDILTIQTYEDFYTTIQSQQLWDKIGDFGLSLSDGEVFTRFQGTAFMGGTLSLNWPKYNGSDLVVGANYQDRWLHADDGLKIVANSFIQLSNTDPRAYINYTAGDPTDPNSITVSLLDMLKLVCLDYHAARMLGLGYLDNQPFDTGLIYIYAAVYTTFPELPLIGTNNDHVFLTLPSSKTDYRLPVAPELSVNYGLYAEADENNPPTLISDPNGYSFYEDSRFINLAKVNKHAPQEVLSTIPVNDAFDSTTITQPISFGIEYKTGSEANWRIPELLFDSDYMGSDGKAETITTPEKETNPLYTHRETEKGIHNYALYSVNWFSRVSGISNIGATDETVFPRRNTLLPPFNLAVQYIQEEEPLIFTTQNEQNVLTALNASNPTGDNYKTRVTFEWDNLDNNAYQSANKAEFFFRATPVGKVEGKTKAVNSISDTECEVVTTSYVMSSVNPAITISPDIVAGDESKFTGSIFNTPDGQFQIISISQPTVSGDGPSFIVKKLVSMEAVQATPDDPVIIMPVYTQPSTNAIFFVTENIVESNQWVKLNKTVDLITFSNQTEIIFEEDGSTHSEIVGGINGTADIEEIANSNGGYTVTFNNGINLSPHPDAQVSWIKGTARFIKASNANKKKRLQVYSIQQTNPIKIVVYDPEYLMAANDRIQTGMHTVNFHPGYRVYLNAESSIFDKSRIMPQGSANNKKTYLAARSVDTTVNYHSSLTSPCILVARNIQKPITPVAILGGLFATRPDFYGKSTYTLDIQLNITNRTPYGIVVYRASEMAILQALYTTQTIKHVLADLIAVGADDPYRFNRWRSLIEVELDDNNDQFKLFGSYRFPNPDNVSTTMFVTAASFIHPFPLTGTLLVNKTTIKRVIEDIFSPLTATPLVFEYLKDGYQTSPDLPKTRDIIERLLSPADISFNPFPMAVKFAGTTPNTVRFTDYTLEGSARNIYFYFAREIAVDTKLSDRTPVAGPVVLVDAAPAEKPKIRRIVTKEADPIMNSSAKIQFDLANYIDSENIKQYQVFRTTEIANATSVRTMQLAATINVGDSVEDDFTDLTFPPYGQPLFYRAVALREIMNEKGVKEMIPSQPSEMVLASIIDVINPVAPEITFTADTYLGPNSVVTAYADVTLTWDQTVYNGTYYLYKMNSKGNWEKLWSIKTNAATITFPENGDFVTFPQTAYFSKLDDAGNTLYYRFKVSVENASGLFNLEDNELVI